MRCGAGQGEGAEVVGYQETELKNVGYNFLIPTFVDVQAATATYDLQNIKIVDGEGDGYSEAMIGYNADAILNDEDYYWCTVDGAGVDKDGWYTAGGDELIENVTLPLGTGLYLNCPTDGAYPQFAGKVYQPELTSQVPQVGYNVIGNATPVDIDLQDIKLVGAEGDGYSEAFIGYNADAILNDEDYYWCTVDGAGVEKDGWYTAGGDELIEGVTLKPGQGLYLNCPTENVSYVLPSPM